MNNKIVSTKNTSAIFLAIVLVTGTIALSSLSFKTANALSGPLFTEDNSYNTYEQTVYPPQEYSEKKYGSYEQDYKMNSYDKKPYGNSYEKDYGMDKKYNNYEPDYGKDSDKRPQIFPANKVAELGDRWWQWIASLNNITDPNPFTELEQAGCDVGLQDDGRLLFLVGSNRDENTGDFPVHKCEIEKGTSILFPIVNVLCDSLEIGTPFFAANETAQRICANNLADKAFDLHVSIDGFEVKNPEQYRIDSPAGGFEFTAVEGNPVFIPAGTGTGVSDAFWILLKPLQPGEHVISFSGAFDWRDVPDLEDIFEFGATYVLDVQSSEKAYYPDEYQQQSYQKY